MILIIPVPIIRRKVIVNRFLRAWSTNKESAVYPADINVKQSFIFSRLEAKSIIISAGEGKYFAHISTL